MSKVKPFDSFRLILKILVTLGYMKPMTGSLSPLKEKFNYFYRILTILVFVLYDLQHTVFIFQVSGNIELIVESLFSLIVAINVTFKISTLFVNTHRFEDLRDVMNEETFGVESDKDEELLNENAEYMNKVTIYVRNAVTVNTVFWFVVPIINKMSNDNLIIPAYFPFETKSFYGFMYANLYETIIMAWVGFGHMTCNCFIAALYSQACVQFKIIRYKLEHLVDDDPKESDEATFLYKDTKNEEIRQRFVQIVKRYDKVCWYTNEVETILSKAFLVQFLASAGVICMVVYKISTVKTMLSFEFMYQSLYLSCLLVELFIYCYFGTLVNDQSNFINQSMYLSDWVSLSPKFRKQMLIAMCRWSRPTEPLAANLVPLSLNTFIRVLRVAYTLFTILKES